jgi:hypothetical protein
VDKHEEATRVATGALKQQAMKQLFEHHQSYCIYHTIQYLPHIEIPCCGLLPLLPVAGWTGCISCQRAESYHTVSYVSPIRAPSSQKISHRCANSYHMHCIVVVYR